MWLALSLLAAFLFAVVHILDAFCVEDIFDYPWMGMIVSAATSLIAILPLFVWWHIAGWTMPAQNIVLFCLLAGAAIQLSQYMYFESLNRSEPGIVAAYWNMIPALIPLGSFIVLREVLNVSSYAGIAILIVSSSYMLLLDEKIEVRLQSFLMMFVACCLQAAAYLLLDAVYKSLPFLQVFLLMTIGLVVMGFSPLLFSQVRTLLRRNEKGLLQYGWFFLVIEIINLLALAAAQKGVDLGHPALVAAAETTIPAFVFFLSFILFGMGHKFGDVRAQKRLPEKLGAVCIMAIGVWMIS